MGLMDAGDVMLITGVCWVLKLHALQIQGIVHVVYIHKPTASVMQDFMGLVDGATHGKTIL